MRDFIRPIYSAYVPFYLELALQQLSALVRQVFHSETCFEDLGRAYVEEVCEKEHKRIKHEKILAYCWIQPASDEVEFHEATVSPLD